MRQLHIDLETYSDVDIMKSGLYPYVQASSFQVMLFAYSWDTDAEPTVIDFTAGEQLSPEIQAALLDPSVTKIAHNATFEFTCLSKSMSLDLRQWQCSMVQAYYLHLPGSLGALCAALRLPQDKIKDRQGTQLINYFCKPCNPTKRNSRRTRNLPQHDPDRWELFKEYNRQDVVAEMAVWDRMRQWPLPAHEWALWRLDHQINRTGIQVDIQLIQQAIQISERTRSSLETESASITWLENPNSISQLKKWLMQKTEEDIESLDKEAVSGLIMKLSNDPDAAEVQRVLEIRQELGKSSVSKYQAMLNAECADGRVRGLLQFYGTGTGRWAGRLVQVQNLPRNYIETLNLARELTKAGRDDALRLVYGNIPDTLSQLIRTAFIASPGHRLVVADFAAIEARVIAWLAGERWRQDVFATTGKIYEASASQMFGIPIEKITKGNPEYELRAKGKVAELALGYQGGVGALIAMGALNMALTEEELPDIVKRWRASSPRICECWYAMGACAIKCVQTGQQQSSHGVTFRLERSGLDFYLTIALPSGRKLFYAEPTLGINQWGNDQVSCKTQNQTTRRWEKTQLYGGKFVENIVQAIARDCLAVAMTRLAKAGYQTVMHIHDEVVLDVPLGYGSLDEVIGIMRQPIDWAPGLILNAAGFENQYYMKD